ncbi:MAG: hypothetical protein IKW78_05870 [Prevotella sp.]|nr:hypothetical protein [Prevotella sp.]
MKKKIFSLLIAMVAAATSVQAQTITAVAPNGATTLYQSLPEAIKRADPGSILYLPGGGFAIGDDDVITEKLTIMGIGHKSQNDNADGITTIVGGLRFNKGSDGSAVIGCYINDQVYIGSDGQVNDVLVKRCNLHSVDVNNAACTGTVISQNYIRDDIFLSYSEATIKNNVIHGNNNYNASIKEMSSGVICNNIFLNTWRVSHIFHRITTATITNNIICGWSYGPTSECGTLYTSGNAMINNEWGDNPVKIEAEGWDAVFEKNGAANSNSNFHFKEAFKQYERQVGIYAGDGFDDTQLAPTPRIVRKEIPDQTDAAGKLNIKIRVKASE